MNECCTGSCQGKAGDCNFCQKRADIRDIGWETRFVRVIGLQGGKIAPDNYREYELRAVLYKLQSTSVLDKDVLQESGAFLRSRAFD